MISIIYHFEAVDQGKTEGLSADVESLMSIVEKFKKRPAKEQSNVRIFYAYKDEFLAQLQKGRGGILETVGPILEHFGGLSYIQK